VCGACTVSIDGVAMRACLSLAHNCAASRITTLEGAQDDPVMRALQDSFEKLGALQCGFCTPGMLIAARALLAANPRPSVEEVRSGLSGNLCRCTGYRKIVDAVCAAAGTE
jgi:carbon-monoxide dehydrogenase small subunit